MSLLLSGGAVFSNGSFHNMDLAIDQGRIVSVSALREEPSVIQLDSCLIVPGFVDVHVHLREPGFSYKETIYSGTSAAAAGGYTAVCAMPNLNPVPDSVENLSLQKKLIRKNARVRVYPYGAITRGEQGKELADLEGMARDVIGFSDDGKGVQSEDMMRAAMLKAKALGKPIVAHSEDESLLATGWAIHDGEFARQHGLIGNNPESEWRQVERDLQLVRETGCQYHVCHISTKETVALIRAAKAEGLPVTCETGPHYLVMCDMDLWDEGRFKMNPPIRSAEDRDALIAGLLDGTIDCIATDHAPHSAEEKSRGLEKSAMGVVGIETAFPVLWTYLVKPGIVPLDTVLKALTVNPAKRFGLPLDGWSVWDLNEAYVVDPKDFVSMGKASPFTGMEVHGKNLMTVLNGKVVWKCDRAPIV